MDSEKIIERLGGTNETAKLCEVSPGAVSQWKTDGIPRPRLMFLRLARPDVFEEPPQSHSGRRSTDKEHA